MKSIENKVHMLAKHLNITVIGSYNPVKIGCSKDEFFDGMHPIFKQVPPKVSLESIHAVFNPNWASLIAQTYPPGPPPITTT